MTRKSLICITTCMRLQEVKKYVLPYIDFCNRFEGFDFLLSLDGYDVEYLDFCKEFHIPLLFSEEREGVGISKNRVLKKLGKNYDYIFFIDDDVELMDETVFFDHIRTSEALNIPHLSAKVIDRNPTRQIYNNEILEKGFKGGGQFNFFKSEVLLKIGGWHPYFSRFRRYGHAEHTYRFFHAEFQDYPFIALQKTFLKTFVHDLPHVTQLIEVPFVDEYFHPEEWKLIQQKLTFYPIVTLSPFYFLDYNRSFNEKIYVFLSKNKRKKYPFIHQLKERRKCLSELYFFHFLKETKLFRRIMLFFLSLFLYPGNNLIKHHVKTRWFRRNKHHKP
ncbi:MAG: hypothetical protein N2Z72_02935 [Bacteroidales bacterium]|nr:hypothetical protein [Bacteroidales bacterium]